MSTRNTRRNRIPRSDRGKTRRDRTRRPENRQLNFYAHGTGGTTLDCTIPSHRRLVPGTLIWAHIDFMDGHGSKVRPCVVLDHADRWETNVAPLSTKATSRAIDLAGLVGDLPATCGFTGTIRRIARTDVVSVAGAVTDTDLARARTIQKASNERRAARRADYDRAA
jgi:hypothetical protein